MKPSAAIARLEFVSMIVSRNDLSSNQTLIVAMPSQRCALLGDRMVMCRIARLQLIVAAMCTATSLSWILLLSNGAYDYNCQA